MIKLAPLQTSFVTLDEALKVTNRRVNALENVTLPHIEGVISYIKKELDEMEREEFTRVKKLKEKKEAQLKGASPFSLPPRSSRVLMLVHSLARAALKEQGGAEENPAGDQDTASMLARYDDARDPDVVF